MWLVWGHRASVAGAWRAVRVPKVGGAHQAGTGEESGLKTWICGDIFKTRSEYSMETLSFGAGDRFKVTYAPFPSWRRQDRGQRVRSTGVHTLSRGL